MQTEGSMKHFKVWLITAAAMAMALVPLASAGAADTGIEPNAQRTHGTVCVTHDGPPVPVHVCVL